MTVHTINSIKENLELKSIDARRRGEKFERKINNREKQGGK